METHVNTYQGLNKDTAYDSIPANQYIDAKDIRITTTSGESQGAYTNIKGNTLSFSIPTLSTPGSPWSWTALNPEVIGHTTIRNRIILKLNLLINMTVYYQWSISSTFYAQIFLYESASSSFSLVTIRKRN